MTKKTAERAPAPPLDLLDHYYSRVNIQANLPASEKEFAQGKPEIVVKPSEPLQNKEDPRLFQVLLSIDSKDKGAPGQYDFGLTVHGIFRIKNDVPEDRWGGLIRVLAPSMLYGAAREFLSLVTARCTLGGIYLPTITFMPSPEESAKQAKTPPRKRKAIDA